jgi:hypothetical protein
MVSIRYWDVRGQTQQLTKFSDRVANVFGDEELTNFEKCAFIKAGI